METVTSYANYENLIITKLKERRAEDATLQVEEADILYKAIEKVIRQQLTGYANFYLKQKGRVYPFYRNLAKERTDTLLNIFGAIATFYHAIDNNSNLDKLNQRIISTLINPKDCIMMEIRNKVLFKYE